MNIQELLKWCEDREDYDGMRGWLRTLDSDASASMAWEKCPRADWLLWLSWRAFQAYTPSMRFAVVEGVREIALPHAGECRTVCVTALDVAERYAKGEATEEELIAASNAACVAARVAGAAANHAGVAVACAAACAAWVDASAPANAAVWAANAVAWAPASDAAWDAACARFADIVRSHVAWADVEAEMGDYENAHDAADDA